MKKLTTVLAMVAIVGALAIGLTASQMQQAHAAVSNQKHCFFNGSSLACPDTSTSSLSSLQHTNTVNLHSHLTEK